LVDANVVNENGGQEMALTEERLQFLTELRADIERLMVDLKGLDPEEFHYRGESVGPFSVLSKRFTADDTLFDLITRLEELLMDIRQDNSPDLDPEEEDDD